MNNPENQVTDVSGARSSNQSNEASPSNDNNLVNDQNNQDIFKDWCEEDGDFEVDEVIQQVNHNETQLPLPPPQQPAQLDGDKSGFDFDDGMNNSGQISSLNNDDQTTNNVVGGQKQNDEEDIETSKSSTTNNNNDTVHFEEELDDMMTDEIGKTNIGNLYAAQNSEVPVQSVLIDQKDVVTLEDEITKSQSPEKVQKSKQSPQKGKQKKNTKKSKADTESSAAEGTKTTPIKNKNDQDDDQDDPIDSDNDPKTKSGRKIQRPEFFNPTIFGRGRRKSSFDPLANESSRKTRKHSGKRRKSKGKDVNVSQESENVFSDLSGMFVDAEEDNIVCNICHDGASIKQNWIVFCDKCDTPYHQRCHKPRIEDIVVEDSQTEWICAKCKASPRSNKRIKVDKKSPEIQEISEDKELGQGLIPIGAVLTREQKVEYLSSLSQDVLVNLLLLAEHIEPNIPLYPANILGKYAAANMSSSKDNEMDETNQNTEESPVMDSQSLGLPATELSNLSTLDTSPDLNPVNIDYAPSQIPEQNTQQEPITPEPSPPLGGLKEIAEHSKDSYLNLYIKAMSEIGNPNGSTAQTMHSWIRSNYNVPDNFAARAKKALNFAVNKGIFVKNSRMTYKFNPDYTITYNKDSDNEHEDEAKNVGVNVNNNNNEYDGQKPTYKEHTSGLDGEEEIPGIGKQNSSSEMKDFNFYPNQDFYFDSMLDANLLGKGDDTYSSTSQSQRSSLSNPVTENNNNNSITDQYSSSSDKAPPPPSSTQSQQISSIPKLPVNAQIIINNEQTLRLPPLAPKPSISVLPSMMRNNSINYQPSHQNEILTSSIGGGGNDLSYSIMQPTQILPKKQTLPLSRANNNNDNNNDNNIITTTATNIRTSSIAPNFSILTPTVIRGNQPPQSQPSQQMFDNTKIRTPSSSIASSLQPMSVIDTSLNGNVNKIRPQQIISIQSSTMHNTPTSIPTSPQQTWPSSFNPFYMSPQPGDAQFTAIFDSAFYDPASQPPQHHHQHSSTASTNDYNNVVLNDLQQHNENGSLFHRMNGNQQQDNNILGTSRSSYNLC